MASLATTHFAPDPRITAVRSEIAHLIRMALFDIDGTIADSRGEVSALTGRAFERLRLRGIGTGLATSRPWFACKKIVDQLSIKDASICFSGALVVDPGGNRVIHERPIKTETVKAFGRSAKEAGLLTEYFAFESHYFQPSAAPLGSERLIAIHSDEYLLGRRPQPVDSLNFADSTAVLKVVVTAEDERQRAALRQLAVAFPDLSHAFVSGGAAQPDLMYLNTTAGDAGRTEALRALAKALRLDSRRNVMAFGDSEGDLPILKEAAVGVALGNAPESVRSAVSYHTLPVDEDGIFHFVMRSF